MCKFIKSIMKNQEEIGASSVDTESSISGDLQPSSQDSSPRSVGGTVSLSDDQTGLKSEDSTVPRVKFLCSYGGKISPRPHDYQLRYVMGETKIVVVNRNIEFAKLMAKLTKLAGESVALKYQLPFEDLDALVSVVSDEDLQNMFEEYEKAESRKFSCRFRLFLFPTKWQVGDTPAEAIGVSLNPEQHVVHVVNGSPAASNQESRELHAHPTAGVPDFLFGLDGASEAPLNQTASLREAKGSELHRADSSAPTVLQIPSSISLPVYAQAEPSSGQACELPLEQMSCQFTRQLSRDKVQESAYPMVFPNSHKSTVPLPDMLHGSEPSKYETNTSEKVCSFPQWGSRDPWSAYSGPLAGVDPGTLLRKPLLNSAEEATSCTDYVRDFKLVPQLMDTKLPYTERLIPACYSHKLSSQPQYVYPPGLVRTSMPLHGCYCRAATEAFGVCSQELQQQKYQELQQENIPISDVSRRGELDRALNGPNYWKTRADFCQESKDVNLMKYVEERVPTQDFGRLIFDSQEETRIPSDRFQKVYISEESAGLISRQAEHGNQSSAMLQHQQLRLHSNSPLAAGHDTYWKAYPQLQGTDLSCEMCSGCNAQFAVKGMLPPY